MQPFIIQSHRGAGALAPENTLEAFTLAWHLGTVPEADVRTTLDGVIVAFHDRNFARVVRDPPPQLMDKGVEEITFADLPILDVGLWHDDQFTGHRVSAMSEVFALMRGRPERSLYLDVKNVQLESLAAQVKEYGVEAQVILASTNYSIIREWKSIVPSSQTLLWLGGDETYLEQRLQSLRETEFADVTQLQIHVHITQPDGLMTFNPSEKFLQALAVELRQHRILFQSLPWNITDSGVYTKLLDLGVQSFATDHPKVTLEAVQAYFMKMDGN